MRLFRFIFKFLTTIIIGIIIGWYLANTQLPFKLRKDLSNTNNKTIRLIINDDKHN